MEDPAYNNEAGQPVRTSVEGEHGSNEEKWPWLKIKERVYYLQVSFLLCDRLPVSCDFITLKITLERGMSSVTKRLGNRVIDAETCI